MLDQMQQLRKRVATQNGDHRDASPLDLTPLRAAAAQILVATGAATSFGRAAEQRSWDQASRPGPLPRTFAWAPLAVAAVAAAAQVEHARRPSEATARTMQVLNGATVAIGTTLLVFDLLRPGRRRGRSLSPLAFISAGLLGIVMERQELTIRAAERDLRRRAEVVERLIPRRRARLDRIVVHV